MTQPSTVLTCTNSSKTVGPEKIKDKDLAVGVSFLSQTVVGVLGNSCLLQHYLLFNFRGCRLRSTHWILMHLIGANILTLLCKGVPQSMAAFGLKDILNNFGCKGLFYLHRVGRGVSIGRTSFLSVFQAITISPMEFKWTDLKGRTQKHIGCSVYLSCILYMLVSSLCLPHVRANYNKNNTANLRDLGYCAAVPTDRTSDILFVILLSVPDFVFVGLMIWASTSIVLILHRHKQRMQHMPRAKVSSRSSPESRATQTILLLVSTFLCFHTLTCIFIVCLIFSIHYSLFLLEVSALLARCFPTVIPFLLLSHESSVSRCFCFISLRNGKITLNSHLI